MSERELDQDTADEERAFFDAADQASDPLGVAQKTEERARHRQRRSVVMLVVFALFIAVLSWLVSDELVYFFRSSEPIDLGQAESLKNQTLQHDSYVRVAGIARDMCIRADLFSERVRFLYLLGSEMGARMLIQSPDSGGGCQGAVDRVVSGRLLDLSRTSRYDSVLAYYREHFPAAPQSGPVYIIEQGYLPRQAWKFPLALTLLVLLALVNLVVLRRRTAGLSRASMEGEGR